MLSPQKSRNESHSVVVWPPKPAPSSVGQPGIERREERLQRLAADPRLDAEPAARDERAHQRRQVRAGGAVRRAREHRERDAVLRARVRVEQDRHEHDRVAEQDREQRLPPVHALRHQARRQHVGRDAVRHRDPQRGVVVGRPVAAARPGPARGRGCRAGSLRARRRRPARRGRRGARVGLRPWGPVLGSSAGGRGVPGALPEPGGPRRTIGRGLWQTARASTSPERGVPSPAIRGPARAPEIRFETRSCRRLSCSCARSPYSPSWV